MVVVLKTFFEQIAEEIMANPKVVEFLNDGNVVEIDETDDPFSVYSYSIGEAPIWMEAIGGGYTWIATKEELSNDYWLFKVHKQEHCDYDDYDYSENNEFDCRNCSNFHLVHGDFYRCNKCGKDIMDPLMEECYAENMPKKDVI